MDTADVIMLSVCVPLLIMLGVLTYILLAVILKEEFGKDIWPFNKEGNNEQKADEKES